MVMGIIRLVLALMVVIFHLPNSDIFGYIGMNGTVVVNSFFIISGFYIALVINEKYYLKEKGAYILFITNRFLKLYPTYFLILIFALIVPVIGFIVINNWLYLQNYFDQEFSIGSSLILGFVNLTMIGINAISFFSIDPSTGQLVFTGTIKSNAINFILIGQAWAVSVELIFYFIAPFLLRKKIPFLFTILILSFLLRLFLNVIGLYDNPWRDRFFATELIFFMFGAISYRIFKEKNLTFNTGYIIYIVPIIILFYIIFYNYIPDFYYYYFSLKEWVFYLLLTICLPILFIISNKMKRLDKFTAQLSYPIFLSHVVMINLVAIFISFYTTPNLAKTLTIILTVIISIAITIYLMNPIEKIRQKRI